MSTSWPVMGLSTQCTKGPAGSAYCVVARIPRKYHVGVAVCPQPARQKEGGHRMEVAVVAMVRLVLERGILTEVTESSFRSTKTYLKESMSQAEAPLCQLAVFTAPDFPSSLPMNN